MPQDLVGLYFDPDKNRYFPVKGPIPGSTLPPKKPPSEPNQKNKISRRIVIGTSKLVHDRELYGNVIMFNKGKSNIQEEYQKLLVSQPVVWNNPETQELAVHALELSYIDLLTPTGLRGFYVLLAGGSNRRLSFFKVNKAGQPFDPSTRYISERVWPLSRKNQVEGGKTLECFLRNHEMYNMPSNISCIKSLTKQPCHTSIGCRRSEHALITTLGSGTSGGSVCILKFSQALRRRMNTVASINCTIWTADYNASQNRTVIGTDRGAALVDLESGAPSWICSGKSDVLSQQFNQSGNIVLCGLRNGAIVAVDVRQRSYVRHQIALGAHQSHKPLKRPFHYSSKPWFQVRGNIHPSQTICMPSSISCLLSLQLYDQYFLASSMDGLMKLYDHRHTRGAVQSYEGNVNSHTRLQLTVDSSERFVMSGGEDKRFRIWNLKSGEMLFQEEICDSVISTICCSQTGGGDREDERGYSWGAWLGSSEGLFRMQWLPRTTTFGIR